MFTITLSPQELDLVLNSLNSMPHGQVKELDLKIRIQAQDQINSQAKAAAPETAPEAE
jgi:hypothetical protein